MAPKKKSRRLPSHPPKGESRLDHLERQLRDLLLTGGYRPHMLFPSRAELVAKYRVPTFTLEKVLTRLVSAGLLYLKPKIGTFVAPRPVSGKLLVVAEQTGAAPGDFGRLYGLPAFLEGLEAAFRTEDPGWLPVVLSDGAFLAALPDLPFHYPGLAGVIFLYRKGTAEQASPRLKTWNIPHVYWGLDTRAPEGPCPALLVSQRALLHGALDHLYDRGRRRILFLDGRIDSPRCGIFRQWEQSRGLVPDPDRTAALGPYREWSEDPDRVARVLTSRQGRYDAVVGLDAAALQALNHLVRSGSAVPKSVAVMGLNNYPICRHTVVELSAVGWDLGLGAGRCVAYLRRGSPPVRQVDSDFVLEIRKST